MFEKPLYMYFYNNLRFKVLYSESPFLSHFKLLPWCSVSKTTSMWCSSKPTVNDSQIPRHSAVFTMLTKSKVGEVNQSSGSQCTGGPCILHVFISKRQKSIPFNNAPWSSTKIISFNTWLSFIYIFSKFYVIKWDVYILSVYLIQWLHGSKRFESLPMC